MLHLSIAAILLLLAVFSLPIEPIAVLVKQLLALLLLAGDFRCRLLLLTPPVVSVLVCDRPLRCRILTLRNHSNSNNLAGGNNKVEQTGVTSPNDNLLRLLLSHGQSGVRLPELKWQ